MMSVDFNLPGGPVGSDQDPFLWPSLTIQNQEGGAAGFHTDVLSAVLRSWDDVMFPANLSDRNWKK